MKDKLRTQSGVAAVEFAVILPILVLIGVGICEFSVIYYDKAMITNASREGARVGIALTGQVDSSGNPIPVDDLKIETTVDNYLQNQLSKKILLLSLGNPSSTTTKKITRDLNASTGTYSPGGKLTVTVTYPYTFAVLPNFIASIINPIPLAGETVMEFQ